MSALTAAINLVTSIKVKHLSLDYNTLRELTVLGVIQPKKGHTYWNLADGLTKPVDRATFKRLIDILMSGATLGKNDRNFLDLLNKTAMTSSTEDGERLEGRPRAAWVEGVGRRNKRGYGI